MEDIPTRIKIDLMIQGPLWDVLKKIAEKNKRTITGQIEFVLENYLEQELQLLKKNEQ